MITNFTIVFLQVLSLFLMMAFGFFGGKKKMITEEASRVISDIIMYFVTPCLLIHSFIREFDMARFYDLLICFGCVAAIQGISILIAHTLFRGNNEKRNRVLRFAVVFSNVGYMGIPLQEAVLGADGVFFGAIYVAVFNLALWSYGVFLMSGDKNALSTKKLLLNPGIIGTVAGICVFLFSIPIEGVVLTVVSGMASLNTPLAMIVIGYFLSKSDLLQALKMKEVYQVAFLRLILVPLVVLGGLKLLGVSGAPMVSMVISASAPVAAVTSMLAAKYETEPTLSANIVAVTTVLSIITMPLIVAFAQSIG